MSTTEPFAASQLAAALRELNIPDVSAPDLGALPFARGGAGIDYAGIAAAVLAQETRPPVGLPSAPSSFYFLDIPAAPAPHVQSAPALPTTPEFGSTTAVPAFDRGPRGLDPLLVRRDFPILQERVNGRELVWLDNAATTQKPASVIARLKHFYEHENSNVHRGAHELAARATDAYEAAREKVRGFLNARSANEIVFVRGATEAINLVAQSWGRQHVGADDEIIVSHLEHHANIVPWQQLAEAKGAKLRVIPVDDSGQLLFDEYLRLLTPRTKIVSVSQVSNALGTVTPVRAIVEQAKRNGIRTLVDGAQAVSHKRVDVREIDCDWYVFSGHKVFAPTGIGVLYGREDLLNASPPWQGGGNMIKDVTFERALYQDAPVRYEAGTGNIADAVGLGAAIDYVTAIGMDAVDAYEHQLLDYATHRLSEIPGLHIIGTAADKAGVLSFTFDGFRTEDLGGLLNKEGIAVRSGHHCAQPILRRFGLEATVRASLALYNTCADIDALVTALQRLRAGAPPRL
jgi:cysteine desulfurase/selenocysteine lyase